LYPLPPLVYSSIVIWTLSFIVINRPQEAGIALAIIVLGFIAWYATEKLSAHGESQ
jgi:APA family basic amino acid/polyamine antiporter